MRISDWSSDVCSSDLFSESGVQTKSSAAALEAENKRLKAEFAQRENAARITAQQTLHSASGAYAEQLVAAGMKPLHAPVVIAALDAEIGRAPGRERRDRTCRYGWTT